MQIKNLRSFIAVAEALHFARAAELLGLAQGTLSQQIAALESQVGVQLLYRDNRNVRLTAAGEVFLAEARNIVALADAALVKAQQVARGDSGHLRVAATGAALVQLAPLLIERLSQTHPALLIEISEHSSMVQESMLLAGEIDVALLHPPIVAEGLRSETLLTEPMVLALWEDHPLSALRRVPLAALAEQTVLIPERPAAPHLHDRMLGLFAAHANTALLEPGLCAPSTVLSLVAARRGVALVPGELRHLQRPLVVFRPLEDTPIALDLAVAWRAGDQRASIVNVRAALSAICANQRVLSALGTPALGRTD